MFKHAIFVTVIGLIIIITPFTAHARPVSYKDSWTVMLRNDGEQNSAHMHYTFDRKHSLGLRVRYDREQDTTFTGAQLNRLFKRWNTLDSQANLYGRIGLGTVNEGQTLLGREGELGLFLGASGDWETRRYFISGALEHWEQGDFGTETSLHNRLGIAPYVAGTGALHTWLMVETHYRPNKDEQLGATALVRLFKGPSLLELGVDTDGDALLNYFHRF